MATQLEQVSIMLHRGRQRDIRNIPVMLARTAGIARWNSKPNLPARRIPNNAGAAAARGQRVAAALVPYHFRNVSLHGTEVRAVARVPVRRIVAVFVELRPADR